MHPDVTLYFVRHGETDWNAAGRYQGQTDIPLNDKGRGQAERNGAALSDKLGRADGIDFVASPLSRTRETMEIVRRAMGLAVSDYLLEDRLKEVSYGHWEGTLWADLPAVDPEGLAARQRDPWTWRPNGGESYADVEVRTSAWLSEIVRDTVVVAHGGVSRTLRQRILGLEPRETPFLEVPQDRVLVLRRGFANWL